MLVTSNAFLLYIWQLHIVHCHFEVAGMWTINTDYGSYLLADQKQWNDMLVETLKRTDMLEQNEHFARPCIKNNVLAVVNVGGRVQRWSDAVMRWWDWHPRPCFLCITSLVMKSAYLTPSMRRWQRIWKARSSRWMFSAIISLLASWIELLVQLSVWSFCLVILLQHFALNYLFRKIRSGWESQLCAQRNSYHSDAPRCHEGLVIQPINSFLGEMRKH